MRARLLAVIAALAVSAGACGTVPSGAVAIVEGRQIPMERFERIVAAQSSQLGLRGRTADIAELAQEVGVLDRAALDAAITQEVQSGPDGGRLAGAELPELPSDLVDDLLASQPVTEDGLDRLGLSEERYREVFAEIAGAEVVGLLNNQLQSGFPLDARQQIPQLQGSVIQQLVQAEIAEYVVEELDLEVPEEAVQNSEDQIRAQLPADRELEDLLAESGYDLEDFRQLFVLTPVRQEVIQTSDRSEEIRPLFEDLDVSVAERFGTWDQANGQLLPPTTQ